MNCYCEHADDKHVDGNGKCLAPDCDCPRFDRAPAGDDEPGTWLKEPEWK